MTEASCRPDGLRPMPAQGKVRVPRRLAPILRHSVQK